MSAAVPPPIPPAWRLWWYLYRLGSLTEVEPDRIDAATQPGVKRLVSDVAARLETSEPPVVLVGNGAARAAVRSGQPQLELPVPMLQCLSTTEIQALVARELAYLGLPRARLVTRLREARATIAPLTAQLNPGPLRGRWRRALAATEPLAMAVERYADEVACRVTGAQALARAEAKETTVTVEFGLWANDLRDDLGTPLLDIHAGWQVRLEHDDVTANFFDDDLIDADDRAGFRTLHAHVVAAIDGLRPDDVALRLPPAADRIPLRPFTPDDEQRLAQEVYFLPVSDGSRFAEVRDEEWKRMMERTAEQAVGQLPGGRVGPAEAVTALLSSSVPMALATAEWTMVRQGWRRLHPAVVGLLTGPDARAVDLRRLVRDAARDPAAVASLVRVLRDV
jgi:hypothetical protein